MRSDLLWVLGSTVVNDVMEPFSPASVLKHGCACRMTLMGDGSIVPAVLVNSPDAAQTTVVLGQCAAHLMQL